MLRKDKKGKKEERKGGREEVGEKKKGRQRNRNKERE